MRHIEDDRLPHDRGFMLWRMNKPTPQLLQSIDTWSEALLLDDDVTGPIKPQTEQAIFTIIAKENGMIAGAEMVNRIIEKYSSEIDILWYVKDGEHAHKGQEIAVIIGCKKTLLLLERALLNCLGQLSGIATNTAAWINESPIPLACTRKTVWGLLDKWAVHLGGGLTHRLSKKDACMIKENDISSVGVEQGVAIEQKIISITRHQIAAFFTIEVRDISEAIIAAKAWKERGETQKCVIMLDNFSPARAFETHELLTAEGLRKYVLLEGSGGVDYSQLLEWGGKGVDVISTSLLNRSTTPLDLSMLVEGA
ncbi:MAG TPA: hypothetical protein EYQ53_05915 [Candidatus Poseidoniales archaeon]|nr:MAG: hypothetical protein CXT69_05355 [Euryarchaeota archaeon]HIG03898.1 hypothetical protein [Candidatus Poseidoniales archaeon]HIK78774.1 hypothetical protein [Candidatus Poseidoniales archaeon]